MQPEIAPSQQRSDNLIRVRDINWADPTIERAGVVPIHFDGKYRWMGLAVSSFSSNITTIGGSYEDTDHDLLETAIREYNEEVGPNLRHIVPESVYNYYAVKTSQMILILLPVVRIPASFTKTAELYAMLWVTPRQLQAVYDNSEYILPGHGPKVRGYALTSGLREIIPMLIQAVASGTPFYPVRNDDQLVRPRRIGTEATPKAVTGIQILEQDLAIPRNFQGGVALVFSTNAIALMRTDRVIYVILPTDLPRIVSLLNRFNVQTFVATEVEKRSLVNAGLMPRLSASVDHLIEQAIDKRVPGAAVLAVEFTQKLGETRERMEVDRIVFELRLILEYELKAYELNQQGGVFFSPKRACYLAGLNKMNILLAKRPLEFRRLQELQLGLCTDLTTTAVINISLNTRFFLQDPLTSVVTIPI